MEIARIFRMLGFDLDAVAWDNELFVPECSYDVVFDIYVNQQKWYYQTLSAKKMLHLTGSDWNYQNDSELNRVAALEFRRRCNYFPRRIVPYSSLMARALELADSCSLIGNRHTLSTYPVNYHTKLTCINVTASTSFIKNVSEYVPGEREFLWFFGGGAVHKGLDLLLEVFARNPHMTLNVVGDVCSEIDFFAIFKYELTECLNIKVHGYLEPTDQRFKNIINRCFCFIAPSCSEGMSVAVATCMQIGLYPIVSRDTGINLPAGVGRYLESCSVEEIETAIVTLFCTNPSIIGQEIAECQKYALSEYSRERFSASMKDYLGKALG
jgi:glycosyltransferase involved in cell wall biosynthesis